MTAPEVPALIVGICGTCSSIHEFDNERARDLWAAFHGHQENYDDE